MIDRDVLRDDILSRARCGAITPDEAEAEARNGGLPPFETQPDLAQFDPMAESRWSIVMAVAWIAWRDVQLVMEQGSGFRSLATHWKHREWNEAINGGTEFAKRSGWFLENWSEPTTVRLALADLVMRRHGTRPTTAASEPVLAEIELWRALSEGLLNGEGFDRDGRLVDIPAREWTHLKLFEDGQKDVLRYDALDRFEPYTQVNFRRDDLLRIWPQAKSTAKRQSDCRSWLRHQITASPSERPKAKAHYFTEALSKFPNLTKRQFERAWTAAVEDSGATAWSKAGRPAQKSNHRTK